MSASVVQAAPVTSVVAGGSVTYTTPGSQVYAAPAVTYTTAPATTYAMPAGSQVYAAPSATEVRTLGNYGLLADQLAGGNYQMLNPTPVAPGTVQVTQGPQTLTYMGAPLASGGTSLVMPSVQYGLANASGSVEVPVYGGSVDVQKLYQTYQAAAPVATRGLSPIQVSTAGMTPEQLKFIFPHGAPANYAPTVVASTVIAPGSSTVVDAATSAVVETPVVVQEQSSSKKKEKKSSKKKVSSKKKAKGGCC